MYIINKLTELYEISAYETTDFILAEYLLTHLYEIEYLSLKDICEATAMSKSVVSRFFKKFTFNNSYSLFKSALMLEIEYKAIDSKKITNDFIESQKFLEKYAIYNHWFDNEKVNKFVNDLKNADKIIFYGNQMKKSYFSSLLAILLTEHKKARFTSYSYYNFDQKELSSLNENDVFVIVEPDSTFYEYNLNMNLFVGFPFDIQSLKVKKYFIGKGVKEEDVINVIGIEKTNNSFFDDVILQYFCYQTLCYYFRK